MLILCRYFFYVIPINNAGSGNQSAPISVTTLQIPPEPAVVTAASSSSGHNLLINLQWLRPVLNGDFGRYEVMLSLFVLFFLSSWCSEPEDVCALLIKFAIIGGPIIYAQKVAVLGCTMK